MTLAAFAVLLIAPAAAGASVSPESIVFGQTTANTTAWVDVYNDTSSSWYMGYAYFWDGMAYSLPYDDCSSTTVAAYGSCWIEVQFDAGDTGLRSYWYYDTLEMPHSDGSGSWGWDYVSLTGEKGEVGGVSVSPQSVDFGSHTDAVIQTVTVTNGENQPIDVSKGTINGGAPFSITADACGLTVASGASCNIDVRFDAAAASPGSYHDSMGLSWDDSAGTYPARVDLLGSVPMPPTAAQLSIAPKPISFGRVGRPATATVTVTQTESNANAVIDSLTAGTAAGAFSISADRCSGHSLSDGQSCTFAVRFAAAEPGRYRGTVTVISSSSKDGTYSARLRGTYAGSAGPRAYVSRGRLNHRVFYPLRRDGYRDSVLYRFRSGMKHARHGGGVVVSVLVRSARSRRALMSWTFEQRRPGLRSHTIRWFGRSTRGRLVRPGAYQFRTQVRSLEGAGMASSPWRTVRVRRGR